MVEKAVEKVGRLAPFAPLSFPTDSAVRFMDKAGEVRIWPQQLACLRLPGHGTWERVAASL